MDRLFPMAAPVYLLADSKKCPLESGHGSLKGCSTKKGPEDGFYGVT